MREVPEVVWAVGVPFLAIGILAFFVLDDPMAMVAILAWVFAASAAFTKRFSPQVWYQATSFADATYLAIVLGALALTARVIFRSFGIAIF